LRTLAAKRDANEFKIIKYLRRVGCSVEQLSQGGIPDLLVGWHGENLLLEVKTATGKLTKTQVEWHSRFKGTVYIVRSVAETKEVLKTCRKTIYIQS
jgi:hypothetical protein